MLSAVDRLPFTCYLNQESAVFKILRSIFLKSFLVYLPISQLANLKQPGILCK